MKNKASLVNKYIKNVINKYRFKIFTKENKKETPWDDYYGNVPRHLEYQENSMYTALSKTSKKYPHNIAYNYFNKKATFKEFNKEVKEAAAALNAIGVREDDDVTICMPNTPEAIIMFYAVNRVGAVANIIHPLSSEKEIEYYIKKAESKYVLCVDLMYKNVFKACENCDVKNIICSKITTRMPKYLGFLFNLTNKKKPNFEYTDKIISWDSFIKMGKNYEAPYVEKNVMDPAVILYSGGTTGEPKAVVLSNLNFNALALQCFKMTEAEVGDNILTILPIFHGFGIGVCVHTAMLNGMYVTLVPQFKAEDFPKLIRKYKPQFLAGVPTLYEALTRSKTKSKRYLSCVHSAICGGDTLNEALKNKVNDYLAAHGSKATIRVGYGLTECTGASCLTPKNFFKEGAIGVPFPDTLYKIVKSGTTKEAKTNEAGEICISGPTVMAKYLNDKKETDNTLRKHADGRTWLHTGDVGFIDENGIVCFESRLKRMIISSGYNVYPKYIEKILMDHPAVETCAVIGIPHPYKVQVPKAYIVLKDTFKENDEGIEEDINKHCIKHLAKYEIPYEYEFINELPKTKVGKIAITELEKMSKEKIEASK